MTGFVFLTLDEFQRRAEAYQAAKNREYALHAKQSRQARAVQRCKLVIAFAASFISLILMR